MLKLVNTFLVITLAFEVFGSDKSKWIISENPNCLGACPPHNEVNIHLPHLEVNKFCQCVWGKPVELQCPSGTHFNPTLEVCTWGYANTLNTTLPGCIGSCPKDTKDDYLPHEDHTKYCRCHYGALYLLDCPSPLEFNPNLNICELPNKPITSDKCYDRIPISNETFKFDFGFYNFRYSF